MFREYIVIEIARVLHIAPTNPRFYCDGERKDAAEKKLLKAAHKAGSVKDGDRVTVFEVQAESVGDAAEAFHGHQYVKHFRFDHTRHI